MCHSFYGVEINVDERQQQKKTNTKRQYVDIRESFPLSGFYSSAWDSLLRMIKIKMRARYVTDDGVFTEKTQVYKGIRRAENDNFAFAYEAEA